MILLFLFSCENKDKLIEIKSMPMSVSHQPVDTVKIYPIIAESLKVKQKVEIKNEIIQNDTTNSKTIYLGMSETMVIRAWGLPAEIIRSKWEGPYEMWVYNRFQPRLDKRISNITYLIIKSDTLISWYDE